MASRDLTTAFIERRTAANLRRRTSENGNGSRMKPFGISKGGMETEIMMEEGIPMTPPSSKPLVASLPPQWVDDVDAINEALNDITRLMGILSSMHATRVGTVFGGVDDMEMKIERMTGDITDKFRHAERLLMRVGMATRKCGGEEALIGTNVQKSLAKKIQELSAEFRQKQRKYLADVQSQKSGAIEETESKFGIDLNETNQEYGINGSSQFNQSQLAVVDDLTQAVQSRDKEIAQIASSIQELGTIFKELAVLVIDQGTILDRIDYNMETVVEHTKEGITHLEKAEKSQKNARPMKCIMCLSVTIFVLLLILILKHRRRWRGY